MYQIAQNSQASPHTGELDVSLQFSGAGNGCNITTVWIVLHPADLLEEKNS